MHDEFETSANRFSPPKSYLADSPASDEANLRPLEVTRAIRALWLRFGLAVVGYVYLWISSGFSRAMTLGLAGLLVSAALSFWLYKKIGAGRNWARVLLLLFSIYEGGYYCTPWPGPSHFAKLLPFVKFITVLAVPLKLYALWLLFFSPGRLWFRTETQARGW